MMRRTAVFVLVCVFLTGGTAYASAPNDLGWSKQWHLQKIHADRAWTKSKGAGVIVAVVDTGVDRSHPDLQGRLIGGVDLVDPGTPPDDEQGHGTFMAGLIAATTGNVDGVASVAPLSKVMPVRVLDEKGTGSPSTVARGVDWAVQHGAKVINLSLAQEPIGGASGSAANLFADTSLDDAINNAADAGAVVVAAAGNNFSSGGTSSTSYTASRSGVIVVGASTKSDRRAAYSNYGSGLDVLAPGGGSSSNPSIDSCQSNAPVVSTWWRNGSSAYGSGCGTSMAVAHVSGIAALLVARGYSNGSAVRRIESTAVDLYSAGKDAQSGFGRVDAALAVGASLTGSSSSRPRTTTRTRTRHVGAASGAKPPAVKGTKIVKSKPTPSPIRAVKLESAGPYEPATDPKAHLVALALALAVGVGVVRTIVRRAALR